MIDEAFAAVTVPSFENAARRPANFDGSPRPGSSSWSTTTAPFLPAISTGAISVLNFPLACAARARRYDSAANSSWSSRVKPYFAATMSPQLPMWKFLYGSQSPSWIIVSMIWPLPMR